jgi:hypothetical protein
MSWTNSTDFRQQISSAAKENNWGTAGENHFISPNNKYWLKWSFPHTWNIYQRYEHSGKYMHAEAYEPDKQADLMQVIAIEGRAK